MKQPAHTRAILVVTALVAFPLTAAAPLSVPRKDALSTPYVVFYRGPFPVATAITEQLPASRTARAERLARLLVAGPTPASGLRTPFSDARLSRVQIEGKTVTAFLEFERAPFPASRREADARLEEMVESFVKTLSQVDGIRDYRLFAAIGAKGVPRPIEAFLPEGPVAAGKPSETDALTGPPGLGQGQPSGSLSGKSIFLSQSHGWLYYSSLGSWSTQRGVTNGIVEDFINAEAINQYLVQYLWNAGANVFTVRERDMGERMVIVDNDGGNGSSTYSETGSGFTTSTATGFLNGQAPYANTTDPFDLGTTREVATSASETARVTFVPDVPATDSYWLYASWSGGSGRAPDAHYIVNFPGGTTHIRVNQQIDGHTWRPLGRFYLEAGVHPATGSIVLANDSTSSGTTVSIDAIRLGGGMGEIIDGGTISGKPRWEEGGLYGSQYLGFSSWLYNDVTARPEWAEWECETTEDCLYFSWHTNAPNPGTGTSSFIYNGGATPGSAQLQQAIHSEIVKDIRSGWDPGWTDRGMQQANFGELRPLQTMPGLLIELAFHDTPYDAAQLKEARFRQLAARAIYQGMTRYYNPSATLLPEPPEEFRAVNLGNGQVKLSWKAAPPDSLDLGGDPATSFRLYLSDNGHGWQDAIPVTGTSTSLTGLERGSLHYAKVSARNAGGESFPTETIAFRVAAGTAPLLLVSGFDRIDASALLPKTDTIGTNLRMQLWRMNSYDYPVAHGEAFAAAGIAFDGCQNEAVAQGAVALGSYQAVDWILGEESTADHTFDATEQTLVHSYLQAGGNLFVSGAEIGWDLVAKGNGPGFYRGDLASRYLADDAYAGASSPANTVVPSSGGIFAGIPALTFDGSDPTIFDVDYPDVLGPMLGSSKALDYQSATTQDTGAAVSYKGAHRVVNMGFPLEAILDPCRRAALARRVGEFFVIPRDNPQGDILAGAGMAAPNPNRVKVFTPDGSQNPVTFDAYGAGRYGVNAASAGLFGETRDAILTGPGPGDIYGPQVRAFDRGGQPIARINFFAYGTLRFGVRVVSGHLACEDWHRIVTGAGPGEVFGPHLRGWRYDSAGLTAMPGISFFPFRTLKYGVVPATGDYDADAFDEILAGAGPGPGFGPNIRGFDYDGGPLASTANLNFFAWAAGGYGVEVSAGDIAGDGRSAILAGHGPGPSPASVRAFRYDGSGVTLLGVDFTAYTGTVFGTRVGAGDVASDGRAEILTGPGPDPTAPTTIHAYGYDPQTNGTTKLASPDFQPFPGLAYGVGATAGAFGY